MCVCVCISVCHRFPGGVETGTRQQAGPERAPETPDRTFEAPAMRQSELNPNNR